MPLDKRGWQKRVFPIQFFLRMVTTWPKIHIIKFWWNLRQTWFAAGNFPHLIHAQFKSGIEAQPICIMIETRPVYDIIIYTLAWRQIVCTVTEALHQGTVAADLDAKHGVSVAGGLLIDRPGGLLHVERIWKWTNLISLLTCKPWLPLQHMIHCKKRSQINFYFLIAPVWD